MPDAVTSVPCVKDTHGSLAQATCHLDCTKCMKAKDALIDTNKVLHLICAIDDYNTQHSLYIMTLQHQLRVLVLPHSYLSQCAACVGVGKSCKSGSSAQLDTRQRKAAQAMS